MKIVHCGNFMPPEAIQTALGTRWLHPGRWVLNHVIAQKQAGLDVELVTIAHKAKRDLVTEIEGVRVHFLRTFHPYRHFTGFAIDRIRMGNYIRKLNPDVVHAHGTEETFALAAIHSHRPFCITAQGLYFQIIPTLSKPIPLHARVFRILEDWAWKRTHFAIAKSEYVRDALQAAYPQLELALIPNTYEADLDHPIPQEKPQHIAFVGLIDYRKGFHVIVEAMKTLAPHNPNLVFHVFGNKQEGQGTEYERTQVAQLRSLLGERLILHGRIPSTALFEHLDTCRCLIAPSFEEMFGNQLIEALMCGCHGIVTDQTALAENVRRFGNGHIVDKGDAMGIVQAVQAVFQVPYDPLEAEKARANIRASMSPAAVAAKHAAFYEHIIHG